MTQTNDQVFINAIKNCRVITRKYIAHLVAEDKTNTIKKYLKSYGIMQLALHLQKLANGGLGKYLEINIDSYNDPLQKRKFIPKKKGKITFYSDVSGLTIEGVNTAKVTW